MDVFLSYARRDLATAASLAAEIRRRGWTVWMDNAVEAGEYWDETIEKAMREARCVIVLWSEASVNSHWVKTEAEHGRKRGILVPARIDSVDPPYGFARLHTADLSNWRDGKNDRGLDELFAGVSRLVVKEAETVAPARRQSKFALSRAAPLLVLLSLASVPLPLMTLRSGAVSVVLQAKASGVTFQPEQSDISELLVVSQVAVTGFKRLELPRTRVSPARTFIRQGASPAVLRLAHSGSTKNGSITLGPISAQAGSAVSVFAEAERGQFRLRADEPRAWMIHVDGVLSATFPDSPPETIDFGVPKPIALYPDEEPLNISFRPEMNAAHPEAAPIRVRRFALARVEERMNGDQLVTQEVSTVISGELRVEGREDTLRLNKGTKILLEQPAGTVRDVRLESDTIAIEFRGIAHGGTVCADGRCIDIRPTLAEWLWRRHPALTLALAAIWIALIAFLLRAYLAPRAFRRA